MIVCGDRPWRRDVTTSTTSNMGGAREPMTSERGDARMRVWREAGSVDPLGLAQVEEDERLEHLANVAWAHQPCDRAVTVTSRAMRDGARHRTGLVKPGKVGSHVPIL